MKKIFSVTIAALAFPMAAFAQAGSMGMAASGSISAQDRSFVTTAAAAGMSEVQEGQLAESKGGPKTKAVGTRMVSDHTMANNKLMAIASAEGISLPSQLTGDQAAQLSELQGMSGTSFDVTYLKDQHTAHIKAIKLFENESLSGTDPKLKIFATDTLPKLKMHLQMIEAAQ
jgi:putative membrane protein